MNIDNIKLVIWFVDDHAHRENVHKPLEGCIRQFAEGLAGGKPLSVDYTVPPELTLGAPAALAIATCWLKSFKFPEGTRLVGNHNRNAEIIVYGIRDWDSLKGYLTSDVNGGLKGRPFWPHLVITDVFKGELKDMANPDDIKAQAGYQFAKQYCVPKQIPCIVISSEQTAIYGCEPEWQGSDNLYYFRRDSLTEDDKVLRTLQKLSPLLLRRWWIPEFTLAVEGRKNPHAPTYQVTFTKDGKLVSVRDVSPVPYAFLYLCVYGSVLARLKGWDKELIGWHDSQCISVSLPKSANSDNHGNIQLLPTMKELFERQYWENNKNEIFYSGDSKTRTSNVLNANIIHLDVPYDLSFPTFWANDLSKRQLMTSMREILPPEGMEWLIKYCSLP